MKISIVMSTSDIIAISVIDIVWGVGQVCLARWTDSWGHPVTYITPH